MTPRLPSLRWTLRRKLLAMQAAGGLPVVLILAFWVWWDIAGHTAGAERISILAGVTPVAGTDSRVITALPRAAVERDVYRSLRTLGVPLLMILSGSSVLAFLVARRVSRPLEALTAAVRRLQQGEVVSVQVTSSDEVGDLARAFNAMGADLQGSRCRLERRVAPAAGRPPGAPGLGRPAPGPA